MITLDNEIVEVLGLMCGDCVDIAPLWIPSSKTLIASDLVFADCHVWLADMRTPQLLDGWLKTLDELDSSGARNRCSRTFEQRIDVHPSAISFTRQYINDFFKQLNQCNDAEQLIKNMDRIYPNYPVRICLEYSAKILKDGYVWPGDWPLTLRHMHTGF